MLNEKKKPQYNLWQNIGWMIHQASNCGRQQVPILVMVSALAAVGVNVVNLLVVPSILKCVEDSSPITKLFSTIAVFIGALLVLSGLKSYLAENVLFGRIDVRLSIIKKLHYKFCTTSYPNTENPDILKKMETATRATMRNNQATEAIWTNLSNFLTYLLCFIIYLILLTDTSWILLVVITATTIGEHFVNKRINEWGYRHRDEAAALEKKMEYISNKAENVALGKDIRIFGMQSWLSDVYQSTLRLYDAFLKRREGVYLWTDVLDAVLTILRNGIAYYYLLHLTLQGNLSASRFLLYFSAVGGFTEWISGILNELTIMSKQSLDICTVREFLNIAEPFRMEGGRSIPIAKNGAYELKLENVSFRYPGAETDTLHKINLTIHPGEKLAIVGLNGAGKTTLVKLLCGLYDPTEGRVLLDGIDIREFNRQEYYTLFTAVFQQFSLLEVTAAENVAQIDIGYDEEKVWNCLKNAGLEERIKSMPNGLETHIGRKVYEDGILLSGGETQRLMLARALYKDAPILLLDEPTAALDPIAENDIYQKYSAMTEGRTSVFISHRLASTRFCDRIIFIESGKISEEGTHEDLMAAGGKYEKLFAVQSKYYQKEGSEDEK